MAVRFHPDNPETGDPEKFLILQAAHDTLSDPDRRAAYDAHLESLEAAPLPIFELKEFVLGIEGEVNRRLGVLSLLYNRRRTSPQNPGLTVFELEKRMGFSREFLEFTAWYLRCKQYVTVGDNSQMALTALGVDYVESKVGETPMLERLLQSGSRSATSPLRPADRPHPLPLLSQPGVATTVCDSVQRPNGHY
jgi:curved DNA-binding protein CbpA